MARCGCNPTCGCLITVANNDPCLKLNIAGLGSIVNPYKVTGSLVLTQSITCGVDNKLHVNLITSNTDTVTITGNGTAANPIAMNIQLTPDDTGPLTGAPKGGENLIKDLGPGLYVSCEDVQDCVLASLDTILGDCLLFDDANGTASIQIDTTQPNGIECNPGNGLLVTPSSDANNALVFGGDDRLYRPATPPFVINDTGLPCLDLNVTGTGAIGDPQILSGAVIVDPNPCNALTCGPAGLFVPRQLDVFDSQTFQPGPAPGVGSPCFALEEFPGCPTNFKLNFAISDDPCNALSCRADGLYMARTRGEACGFQGLAGPNALPAGSFPAGSIINFFSQPFQYCNTSCCRLESQVTITFAGINAFIDFNSVIRVRMAFTVPPTPFPPAGNTFPVDDQIYDTFLFNPGPPGFKNTPLQAQDSFWNIMGPGECVNFQWRMQIVVEQGNIRQFVLAPNSQGLAWNAILTGYAECDCSCNGFVPPGGENACPQI